MKINIITPNYAYYKIFQLTLRYEYFTALFFPKTSVICIINNYVKKLFEYFKHLWPHNYT
jgi:hypothetical protein